MRPVLTLLLAVLVGSSMALVVQAAELRQLLTDFWTNTREARDGLDAFVRSNSGIVSPEFRYAEILVLIKQRRFSEAIKASEIGLRDAPDHARMRQVRIWLLLVQGQEKQAVAELGNLAVHWDAVRGQQGVTPLDLANWAGRAFGVLDGPRKGRTNQQAADRAWDMLLRALNDQERQSLESGQADVLQAFRDGLAQLELTEQEESMEQSQERHEEGIRLAEQLDRVDRQLADVATQARDVTEHYAEGRRAVQEVTPGIVSSVVESDRREAWATWQVISLQSEIRRLDHLIAHEKDPDRRRQLQLQRDALIAQLQWDGLALDQATANRVGSQVALRQAQNELAANQAAEAREKELLARRQQQLVRSQTTAQRRQERLVEPVRRIIGRIRSLRRSLEAVTTYLDFPLDEERARLLRADG